MSYSTRRTLHLAGPTRYRLDPELGEVMVARYRPRHRCRSCHSELSAQFFGPSRILKRDYECVFCHATRCRRERTLGTRGGRRPKEL